MKFLDHNIGDLVMKELGKACEASVAVAFFNPDDRMMDALAKLPKLKLIVSEEFTVNNPYKLEKLKLDMLRSIAPDDVHGKLHAKILILKRRDGSYWTLIGSANLTHQRMFSNQEACMVLESSNLSDDACALEIRRWFDACSKGLDGPILIRRSRFTTRNLNIVAFQDPQMRPQMRWVIGP